WLADYGLVPLLWLPAGRTADQLNAHYAAPETGRGTPGPTADQFSLALIYAEMLSGFLPRSAQRRPGSGLVRRPRAGRAPELTTLANRIDLDLVVAPDREALARALHDDPARRFPSCTALVEALEAASPGNSRAAILNVVPRIVTCAELRGEDAPADLAVP